MVIWLFLGAAALACPDRTALLTAAELALQGRQQAAADDHFDALEEAVRCDTPLSPGELARFWVLEGVWRHRAGDPAGALASLRAAQRLKADLWYPWIESTVQPPRKPDAASEMATLVFDAPEPGVLLLLDGVRVSAMSGSVAPGLHLVQAVGSEGLVIDGKIVAVNEGDRLEGLLDYPRAPEIDSSQLVLSDAARSRLEKRLEKDWSRVSDRAQEDYHRGVGEVAGFIEEVEAARRDLSPIRSATVDALLLEAQATARRIQAQLDDDQRPEAVARASRGQSGARETRRWGPDGLQLSPRAVGTVGGVRRGGEAVGLSTDIDGGLATRDPLTSFGWQVGAGVELSLPLGLGVAADLGLLGITSPMRSSSSPDLTVETGTRGLAISTKAGWRGRKVGALAGPTVLWTRERDLVTVAETGQVLPVQLQVRRVGLAVDLSGPVLPLFANLGLAPELSSALYSAGTWTLSAGVVMQGIRP